MSRTYVQKSDGGVKTSLCAEDKKGTYKQIVHHLHILGALALCILNFCYDLLTCYSGFSAVSVGTIFGSTCCSTKMSLPNNEVCFMIRIIGDPVLVDDETNITEEKEDFRCQAGRLEVKNYQLKAEDSILAISISLSSTSTHSSLL
jgi:hypothetical protein